MAQVRPVIPRRLIRVVPEHTTPEADGWWAHACALHPTWEHVTFRDPIDPALFPLTSPLWSHCKHGAQMAGLVRLEAIWRLGGWYLDSDLELLRPLDVFQTQSFIGVWEDDQTIPDFAFAAEARHPVSRVLLDAARVAVARGAGAWASGPGVFTETLRGRTDVLLLPPQSFAPVHYSEKRDADWSNPEERWPYAHGVHHYAFSWEGQA